MDTALFVLLSLFVPAGLTVGAACAVFVARAETSFDRASAAAGSFAGYALATVALLCLLPGGIG